ncbi:hypothetical protein [Paraflavitalea sp. CAU 1676]|uniref:hypothetical protein n=1 Tax=Paraflavitalea sp. CAU 1676 TaxID=3032598 RepID=UPI0023D9ACD5|nr:hypothetical protein [Paraflavitalea sp. CAU 1676]MDF2188422.1 hypothetical protein [Paraflavitalea sp. CAU 1676]
MKKIYLMSLWLLAFQLGYSQVVLNLQLPPMGLTIKPQLWNLSLVNTSKVNMEVRIEMVMTNVTTNQRVLTGTSKSVLLMKGIKQFQLQDLMPITYNVGSGGYGMDPSPEGFLPTGVYTICYSVLAVQNEGVEKIAEECETIEIEPISPPQLMIPMDEEKVEITRPFFAWIPPSPIATLNSMLYDWVLVEVQPTQSAADAVQQNVPLLSRSNLSFTNFQYPLSSPELDTSKLYAWRITAKNNLTPVGNSEVWSFRVRLFGFDSTLIKTGGEYFTKLRREEDAAYIICSGVLHYEYLNELNDTQVSIKLFDISDAQRREIGLDSASRPVQFGQNFNLLDLRQLSGMKDKHMYLLEVMNAKREKWYLKFEYRE